MKPLLSQKAQGTINTNSQSKLPNVSRGNGLRMPKKLPRQSSKHKKHLDLTKYINLRVPPSAQKRKRMIQLAYNTHEERAYMNNLKKELLTNLEREPARSTIRNITKESYQNKPKNLPRQWSAKQKLPKRKICQNKRSIQQCTTALNFHSVDTTTLMNQKKSSLKKKPLLCQKSKKNVVILHKKSMANSRVSLNHCTKGGRRNILLEDLKTQDLEQKYPTKTPKNVGISQEITKKLLKNLANEDSDEFSDFERADSLDLSDSKSQNSTYNLRNTGPKLGHKNYSWTRTLNNSGGFRNKGIKAAGMTFTEKLSTMPKNSPLLRIFLKNYAEEDEETTNMKNIAINTQKKENLNTYEKRLQKDKEKHKEWERTLPLKDRYLKKNPSKRNFQILKLQSQKQKINMRMTWQKALSKPKEG
ncbi:unnamed protein product [Moneuplotes crassus]|uniref:Uncharacterized protein n=1 Tax=Euplotes crassus TaxID=5936 RepID=A0AAD1U8J4_EUPCR|nr:unnamed protein product [Moneuplotes crassus]